MTLALGLAAFECFGVSQREGAAAMGLAFFIAPIAAVACSLSVFMGFALVRNRSKDGVREPKAPSSVYRAVRWLLLGIAAITGWCGGVFLQWLAAGRSFESYLVALAVALAPWLGLMGISGTVCWLLWKRRTSR